MLRGKYFYSADLEKATSVEVGAHDMGTFDSPLWKKLKENRFYLPEASWVETANPETAALGPLITKIVIMQVN